MQRALVAYAHKGGTVVFGPKAPDLDSLMRPCTILADALAGAAVTGAGAQAAQVGGGRLVLISDLGAIPGVLGEIATQAGLTQVFANDPALDIAVHSDPADATSKLVFVANPTTATIEAKVSVAVDLDSARELWSDREVPVEGNTIAETLAPYSINIYRCTVTA